MSRRSARSKRGLTVADEIVFVGKGLQGLAKNMRSSAVKFRQEMEPMLLEIGEEVATRAKVNASSAGSSSIPPTIDVRPLPGAVGVYAGTESKPLARLWEMGNIRSGGRNFLLKGGTFDHPIFAKGPRETWRWTGRKGVPSQQRHRFLAPALAEDRRGITKRMEAAWEKGLAPLRGSSSP